MRALKPTMADIARRAGVSKNTVSLALRHDPQIPPPTRARIRKIAQRLGYRKNPTVAHLMVQLRASRSPRHQSALALVNANLDPCAFTRHPTVPVYVEGCRRRAAELGYSLDEFWLHDPALDGPRLNRILRARNIRGAVIVGLMNENILPARFLATWKSFPCVVTGVRTQNPALPFACVDHHMLALKATEKALDLGYRRPALVLDTHIDRLVDGRFTAGMLIAQQSLPAAQRTNPFYFMPEARDNAVLFRNWLRREKPDAILTLYHVVRHWLENAGLHAPRDIALIQMERRRSDWAGMNQHNDLIGAAAVEMLIGMIHHDQAGPPRLPSRHLDRQHVGRRRDLPAQEELTLDLRNLRGTQFQLCPAHDAIHLLRVARADNRARHLGAAVASTRWPPRPHSCRGARPLCAAAPPVRDSPPASAPGNRDSSGANHPPAASRSARASSRRSAGPSPSANKRSRRRHASRNKAAAPFPHRA